MDPAPDPDEKRRRERECWESIRDQHVRNP
jgi:hypothetical protein